MGVDNRNSSVVLIFAERDVIGIQVVRSKFTVGESVVSFKSHVRMRSRQIAIQGANIRVVADSRSAVIEAR